MRFINPHLIVTWDEFCDLPPVRNVLVDMKMVPSLSDADRLIKQGAVRVGSSRTLAGQRVVRDSTTLFSLVDIEPSVLADPTWYDDHPDLGGYEAMVALLPHVAAPFAVLIQVGKKNRKAILLTEGPPWTREPSPGARKEDPSK